MQQVPADKLTAFGLLLDNAWVPPGQRPDYHKWLRFYLDFCQIHGYSPRLPTSLGPFLNKLLAKNQSVAQRSQAATAIKLFLKSSSEPRALGPRPQTSSGARAERGATAQPHPRSQPPHCSPAPAPATASGCAAPSAIPAHGCSWQQEYLDLEAAIRLRNYSPRTLEAYRFWIAKFQAFVASHPTATLGTPEVRGFLSSLAVRHHVSALRYSRNSFCVTDLGRASLDLQHLARLPSPRLEHVSFR
jgi:hypothetical protein